MVSQQLIEQLLIMDSSIPIVGSSTPDGLAPLSQTALIIFASVILGLSLIWTIFNFIQLIRRPLPGNPEQQGQQASAPLSKNQQIFMMLCQRILLTSFNFLKFNFFVSLVAGIIFFLIILGAIQNFEEPYIALSYLYGLLSSILIGIIVSVGSHLSLPRIGFAATDSVYATHVTARNMSNFISFFIPSFTTLIIFLIIITSQTSNMTISDIHQLGKELIAFAFGVSTAAIGTKINSVIYGKASQSALPLMNTLQPTLPRDHTNPIIICKSVGQNVRKVVSNALDYNMYLAVSLSCALSAAGNNIIGADQNGQIIFDYAIDNIYLPLLAFLFLLFFYLIANILSTFLLAPHTGDESAIIFKREIYFVIIFMIGFSALAAYLCLPVEFFLAEVKDELKGPVLAYLVMLISMVGAFALMLFGELQANHPRFLSSLIYNSKFGISANILQGLALGYLGNGGPIIFWAGISFLSYYWLGSFGLSLMSIGVAILIPNYLAINTYFSLIENTTFVTYVGQLGQNALINMMSISQYSKVYQIQIHTHFTSLAMTTNYALVLNFISTYSLVRIPLTNPSIYIGIFIGSMIIYSFGSMIIFSIQKVTPILCYDMKAQIQENASVLSGGAQPDLQRSNFIFTLNSILQLKYFLPFLYIPFVLFGLVFGPKMTLGVIIGMMVVGLQLAFSSGFSGNIWNSVRSQIFLGRAMSQENESIKADSANGKAADIGNQVGMRLKDAIGSCVHGFISFTSLTNIVMAAIY